MSETTSPVAVKILEAGPTSPGGGLHEEGDLGMNEMWHAATSADIPAPMAMATGGGIGSAARAPPVAPNLSMTGAVGGMVLENSTRARVP
jgi:hypothetical protein